MHFLKIKGFIFSAFLCLYVLCLTQFALAKDITVRVENELIVSENKPVLKDGRVLVPVSDIYRAIGADIGWNETSKTVFAQKGDITTRLVIGNENIYINDEPKAIDAKPVIINGRTYIPARFAVEAFGYKVAWNGSSKEVSIYSKEDPLTVTFLNVGQGDSAFLECGGQFLLVDSGEKEAFETVRDHISAKTDRIDHIIVTHPHSDHMGSMSKIIDSFDVGDVIMPMVENNTDVYESMLNAIVSKDIPVKEPHVGEGFHLGSTYVTILSPGQYSEDMNANSVVVRVDCMGKSFLLTGDATKEAESEMLKDGLVYCDVLKVAHHGSDTSSGEEFIAEATPEYSVISLGENTYGHPHKEVLERLKDSTVLRTDREGEITFTVADSSLSYTTVKKDAPKLNTVSDLGEYKYILNTSSHRIHYPWCEGVSKMSEKNKQGYNGDINTLEGYKPCGICNPT